MEKNFSRVSTAVGKSTTIAMMNAIEEGKEVVMVHTPRDDIDTIISERAHKMVDKGLTAVISNISAGSAMFLYAAIEIPVIFNIDSDGSSTFNHPGWADVSDTDKLIELTNMSVMAYNSALTFSPVEDELSLFDMIMLNHGELHQNNAHDKMLFEIKNYSQKERDIYLPFKETELFYGELKPQFAKAKTFNSQMTSRRPTNNPRQGRNY